MKYIVFLLSAMASAQMSDDFNRADGAPGSSWTTVSGGWAIVSNRLQPTSGFDAAYPAGWIITSTGAPAATQTVQAKVWRGAGNRTVGLIARYSSATGTINYYVGYIRNLLSGGDEWRLYRYRGSLTNGTFTQLGATAVEEFVDGSTVRLVASGSSLALQLWTGAAWATKVSATDTTLTSGIAGLRANDTGSAFDDFAYTPDSLPADPPAGSSGTSLLAQSAVQNLVDDLTARPTKAAGFAANKAVRADSQGKLSAVPGADDDCVKVDGSSGVCGASGGGVGVWGEVPSGTINGTNAVFTLAHTPASATLRVYRNGVRLKLSTDYSVSGTTITFLSGAIPQSGDLLVVDYNDEANTIQGDQGPQGPPGDATSDSTAIHVAEEFLGSHDSYLATDNYGLGWSFTGYAAAKLAGIANHPGVVDLQTTYGANGVSAIYLGGGAAPIAGLASGTNWSTEWIIRTPYVSQVKIRVGFLAAVDSQAVPSDGIWARFASSSGCTANQSDTTWMYETRNSSTSSTAAGPAIAQDGWYKIRMRSTTIGQVKFAIATNGGSFSAEQTISTNVPDGALYPAAQIVSCADQWTRIHLDSFRLDWTGLTR